MEMLLPKQIYHQDSDLSFEVEEVFPLLFLHVTYAVWTPRVLRKSYQILGKLMNEAESEGFTQLRSISPNPKFCKLMGAESVSHLIHDNKEYEVVKWELK